MKRREEGWEGQGEVDRGGEEREGKVQGKRKVMEKRRGKRVWEGRKEWGGGRRDEWIGKGMGKAIVKLMEVKEFLTIFVEFMPVVYLKLYPSL
jgi:hypothetical protein